MNVGVKSARRKWGGRVCAGFSLVGLAILGYVLGAAVMFFQLPTSGELTKSFQGAQAWSQRGQRPDPDALLTAAPMTAAVHRDLPGKTDDGFTLYTSTAGPWAALLDMHGQVVHSWKMPFRKAWPRPEHVLDPMDDEQIHFFGCRLLANGDLLASYHAEGDTPYGYGLVKLDKDSNVLWTYAKRVHHLFDVDDAGQIYVLTQKLTNTLPAGLDFVPTPFLSDSLAVLTPDGITVGEPIAIMEVLRDSPYAGTQRLLVAESADAMGDITHCNHVSVLSQAVAHKFPQFKAGQVLISVRNMNALALIDIPARKVGWLAVGQWRMQHTADFLANGHILVYDNLGGRKKTRVLEVDPATRDIAWAYSSTFLAKVRGTAQRLPNGNTLVVDPESTRMFEITPDREVVWEVICMERPQETAGGRPIHTNTPRAWINTARRYRADELSFLQKPPRSSK